MREQYLADHMRTFLLAIWWPLKVAGLLAVIVFAWAFLLGFLQPVCA